MITRLLGPSLLLSPPVPFQAPPRLSLVDDIRSSVQRRYRAEDVQRVLSAWDAMADGYVHEEELPGFEAEPMLRQQSNSYVDGLPIRLFYEEPARDFAWAQALEEHAHVVRDEFLSVTQSGAIEREGHDWTGLADLRDESTVAYGPEWRTLGLLDRGVWDPVNCRLFPKTVALLKESKTPCVEAFFAKHEAGSLTHAVVTLGPAVAGVDKIFTEESTLAKVQEQFFKFNVPWAVAKHGAAKLADGGSLTFFSGTLSRAVAKNASCLGPVNAAIESLGKCLAIELGPRLRVNVVSPTLTRTSAVTGGMTPEQQEGMFTGFGKTIPAGRSGEPADMGHAVAFLLTNNFMTGCVLDVDGGNPLAA